MEPEKIAGMVEQRCPYARRTHVRVRTVAQEDGRVTMALEESPDNLNAFGLVHAGAICGFAETAAGAALLTHLDPSEYIVLNTFLNVRFTAPGRGELTCSTRVTPEEFGAVMEEVISEGKAGKTVDFKVRDESGRVVASGQATFRIMPTPDEYRKYFA